ncbi:MAG: hypothetical protein AAFP97_08825 [Pseudomonadota bacterium]
MFASRLTILGLTTALLVGGCSSQDSSVASAESSPLQTASETSQSVALPTSPTFSVLEFGGPNLLFAASNTDEKVFAFTLDDAAETGSPPQPTPYNLTRFGSQLATKLGVSPLDIKYHDLAVHPVTTAAYLSVSANDQAALVKITQDGNIAIIDAQKWASSSVNLAETADKDVTFWRDIPATSLSVTDLEFDDGTLYVAGLSTGEFASTLRQFDFPFTDQGEANSIEMFHTAHNQNETRAPIRAMAMTTLNGQKTLVAAYTCTPLVTVAASSLQNGDHVVGKTVAELGYGNVPVEVLSVTAYNMQQQPEDFILVINREMSADLIRKEDLAVANSEPGITTGFSGLGDTMGVETSHHPLGGVIQADNQDQQFLLFLRRDLDTGEIELISQMKGAYFRLSDFVSEYNFPDYAYPDSQEGTKQFQNVMKSLEGYPELAIQ